MSYNTLKHIPLKKQVPGTTYTIDCFNIACNYCTHYFLSHFHADHYSGLKRSFTGSIYCSETTANLVHLVLKVPRLQINTFCIYKTYQLAPDHFVTCLDANHCPGAVCFVFSINGRNYLHTGDFRAAPCFYEQPLLDLRFDIIFLDNTFENYRSFCAQRDAVKMIIEMILKKQSQSRLVPLRFALLFSSYLVGKERCFLSVAEYFDKCVTVSDRKMHVYRSYCSYSVHRLNREVLEFVEYARKTVDESLQKTGAAHSQPSRCCENRMAASCRVKTQSIVRKGTCASTLRCVCEGRISNTFCAVTDVTEDSKRGRNSKIIVRNGAFWALNSDAKEKTRSTPFNRITTEVKDTNIFLVSACSVNRNKINSMLRNIRCDRAVVFCGTGWAGKTVFYDLERQNMVTRKGIEVIYIPYSEHSSSEELVEFKGRVSYASIINTVK